jgi:hypothetical protein
VGRNGRGIYFLSQTSHPYQIDTTNQVNKLLKLINCKLCVYFTFLLYHKIRLSSRGKVMSFLAKAGYGTRVPQKVIDTKLVSTFPVFLEIHCLIWYLLVCFTGSYFGLAESGHTSHTIRLSSTLSSHSRLQCFFSVVFRSDSGSLTPFTGLRDHTQTHHTR